MPRMTREQFLRRAKAYGEWVKAAAARQPRTVNPYGPNGTDEAVEQWEQWNEGWQDQTDY